MDTPLFFGPNSVNANCAITVSTGEAVKYRLYDRDWNALWQTIGQNSDSSPASVEVIFKDKGVEALRTLDTLFLQNINAATVAVDFKDLSGWTANMLTLGTAHRLGVSLIASVARGTMTAQQASGVRFRFIQTQTPNQEKHIGEIWALQTLFSPAAGFYDFQAGQSPVGALTDMADGSVRAALIKWSGDRTTRWGASLSFAGLPTDELAAMTAVYQRGSFTLWPEPETDPQGIYGVSALKQSLAYSYAAKNKSSGRIVGFQAAET